MAKQRLDDARREYLQHRISDDKAAGTLRNDDLVLTRFIDITGNIWCHNVKEHPHIDRYFTEISKSRSATSRCIDHDVLNHFFKYCIRNKKMAGAFNPIEGRSRPKIRKRPWRGVAVHQIPALIDAAWNIHPRDGILVAQSIFLLGRSIELTDLKLEQVDLNSGFVYYYRSKTNQDDTMPINNELDRFYRRWFTYYAEQCGPLQPDWHVVPRRSRPQLVVQQGVARPSRSTSRLLPSLRLKNPYRQAQGALAAIGFPLRNPDGSSRREGMHTFRRTGAKAIYWQLVREGDPNPIQKVQSQLGHATEEMTRRYIGEEVDREARNERFRGRDMFPGLFEDANVVPLHPAAADGTGR